MVQSVALVSRSVDGSVSRIGQLFGSVGHFGQSFGRWFCRSRWSVIRSMVQSVALVSRSIDGSVGCVGQLFGR